MTEPLPLPTPPVRSATLMRVATFAAVGCAVTLVGLKGAAYAITNSVAMLSSLADSALDLLASMVNLLAVRHALTPADEGHTFGHGKAEPLSALGQSAFIAGSAVLLVVESASRFGEHAPVERGDIGVAVMVFSMAVTLALVTFQKFVARRTGSTAIGADALHYTGDILMNLSVIVAIVLSTRLGVSWADPVFGIGIAVFLVFNAWRIASRATGDLMDQELPQADRERVIAIARQHPKVRNVHELRTRKSGVQTFIQMHLVLDNSLTLLQAHRISDDVEKAVMAEFPGADVIIHEDPDGIVEVHRPVGADL
ncbi:MAG: cation diffusion facilitator family transporter [Rhodospirillaceae bacterium]|nr:cation diffusion facilitator family transporter [Rhodospirillaceae bacterium]